ncbi:MAG TPA: DNA-formamidopyrimidine glycosylase family protein [Actinomycetes bacterium]|nr:DNA-formamidopyrimidine glycosylase family protein [Actinomycetes bacterium]
MPEGDTVWNTAQLLHRKLAGQVLDSSDFRVPQLATVDLAGWTVAESRSRGKHLLLRLDSAEARPRTLHSHLRMDGSWRVFAPGQRWAARPAHTIRVVLRTRSAVAVGYHLHELALVRTEDEERLVGHLGPDLLGPDWDPGEAVRRLCRRPEVAIGAALIDQRNLAGIGNLYKAETLFLGGVWPWTPVGSVEDLPALVTHAQHLMAANQGRAAQVTTGSSRRGERNFVFERAGRPCRRCGTAIELDVLGDRLTYWCPRCQPATGDPGQRPDSG